MNIGRKAVATASALALCGAAAFALAGQGFHFLGSISRIITPMSGSPSKSNGAAFICYDNPADSGVTGQVFTLLGKQVADLTDHEGGAWSSTSCATAYASYTPAFGGAKTGYMSWDGTSRGSVVYTGIYVYRIQAEGGTYTGTLVVVR